MKITYRIPTKEPFAFVEVVAEDTNPTDMTPEVIKNHYEQLTSAFKEEPGTGLPTKEWAQVRKSYLAGEPLSPDTFYAMNENQKFFIQEIKKELRANK